VLYFDGGQGRNRTADASLFRAALYQLSYLAKLIDFPTRAAVGSVRKEFFCPLNSIDYNNR
jgi:hypothetical protein